MELKILDQNRRAHKANLGKKGEKMPALFMDRDGVIIKEKDYIKNAADVATLEGALEAIERARKNGLLVFVITNQAGIGRGLLGWKEYNEVTLRMLDLLGNKLKPDAIYANSYTSVEGRSSWRKPGIGMLEAAATDYGVDLSKSIIVGDRWSDIMAGLAGGLKGGILYDDPRSIHKAQRDAKRKHKMDILNRTSFKLIKIEEASKMGKVVDELTKTGV